MDPNRYATDTWVTLVQEPDKGAARHLLSQKQDSRGPTASAQTLNNPEPQALTRLRPQAAETSRFATPNPFNALARGETGEGEDKPELGNQKQTTRSTERERRTLRVLDLFSGTGSVGKVLQEHGYEVVSLDNQTRWQPTHCQDILTWNYRQYPQDILT